MQPLKTILSKFLRAPKKQVKGIVVGIDTPSYQLAQILIKQHQLEIIAFIDDEPWSNRTELLGATVRYPSDICALIERKGVDLLIYFNDQDIVPESVFVEIKQLDVTLIELKADEPMTVWANNCERYLNA